MIRKKTVIFTFFILMAFVIVNFFVNVFQFRDVQYISQMYDPIKKLTLSNWSVSGYFMMEYYPLLVVIPTACVYLTDKSSKVKLYIESRVGKNNYWYGKAVCVFLVTFAVFTIPFLIEILLEGICFSMQSSGDPSGFEWIQTIQNENQMFLSGLWIQNKVLYALLMTILFGVISGVLAVFNFAVTTLPFFKYKIFSFFPIYILFYFISFAEKQLHISNVIDYSMNYFFILRMFHGQTTAYKYNYKVYFVFLILLLAVSFLFVRIKTKKDDII